MSAVAAIHIIADSTLNFRFVSSAEVYLSNLSVGFRLADIQVKTRSIGPHVINK